MLAVTESFTRITYNWKSFTRITYNWKWLLAVVEPYTKITNAE